MQRYTLVFTIQIYAQVFYNIFAFILRHFCICLWFKPLIQGHLENIFQVFYTIIYSVSKPHEFASSLRSSQWPWKEDGFHLCYVMNPPSGGQGGCPGVCFVAPLLAVSCEVRTFEHLNVECRSFFRFLLRYSFVLLFLIHRLYKIKKPPSFQWGSFLKSATIPLYGISFHSTSFFHNII